MFGRLWRPNTDHFERFGAFTYMFEHYGAFSAPKINMLERFDASGAQTTYTIAQSKIPYEMISDGLRITAYRSMRQTNDFLGSDYRFPDS